MRREGCDAPGSITESHIEPVDATNLGIVITATRLSNRNLQLQIALDPKQFLWQESGDRLTDTLDLLNTQRESSGMILRAESQHVVLNLNHNQYQRLIQLDSRCNKLLPWNLWLRTCVSPCATPARLP